MGTELLHKAIGTFADGWEDSHRKASRVSQRLAACETEPTRSLACHNAYHDACMQEKIRRSDPGLNVLKKL